MTMVFVIVRLLLARTYYSYLIYINTASLVGAVVPRI